MLKVMTIVGTRPGDHQDEPRHRRVRPATSIMCWSTPARTTTTNSTRSSSTISASASPTISSKLPARRRRDDRAGASPRPTRSCETEKPEAVLFYGDTNSCLAVIAAKRRKIPVFHMEAGNRCFDQRVPEELNRKVIDHLSDINMTLTEHARRYLLAEGFRRPRRSSRPARTWRRCSTTSCRRSRPPTCSSGWVSRAGGYFLVSAHREENVDAPRRLDDACSERSMRSPRRTAMPVIVSTHPRTRKRLDELRPRPAIVAASASCKPFGFLDYVKLQTQRLLRPLRQRHHHRGSLPARLARRHLRDAHERPEGMDAGTLVMSSLDADDLMKGSAWCATASVAAGVRAACPTTTRPRSRQGGADRVLLHRLREPHRLVQAVGRRPLRLPRSTPVDGREDGSEDEEVVRAQVIDAGLQPGDDDRPTPPAPSGS